MPAAETPRELLHIDGRDVGISNPEKVLFPQAGHTKLDLVRYYLAVADGALRGAGGRPNVLVRHPHGVGGEFFYQKRAPASRPRLPGAASASGPRGRSLEPLLDLAARQAREGLGDAPWPPHYRKQAGEGPRVQPSKRKTKVD